MEVVCTWQCECLGGSYLKTLTANCVITLPFTKIIPIDVIMILEIQIFYAQGSFTCLSLLHVASHDSPGALVGFVILKCSL